MSYDSPYILWTATVMSSPNTGNTTIVIQLSAHYEHKNSFTTLLQVKFKFGKRFGGNKYYLF